MRSEKWDAQIGGVKFSIRNLKSEIAIDVLCVGHAAYDISLQVSHHPGADEKCFAGSRVECVGGPAANAAVTVARLGGRSGFAGYLGNDLYGERHFRELSAAGVNTDLLARGDFPTPLSVILVKPGGQRTVINHKNQTPPLTHLPHDLSSWQIGAILFDGHEPDISLPLAEDAKSRGIPTLLDAGSVHRGTLMLTPQVDFLIASAKFAREFTGKADPEAALPELAALAPAAMITLGERGLLWKRGEESGSYPAFAVEAIDTTGAGDVFHGAFALGVVWKFGFPKLLQFASAAAALSCTKSGARNGIPGAKEVERFLEKLEKPDLKGFGNH
ncbi:MAG: carbohydrate kinase [Calditrichaceae bacterium]|nr:PfkB family carbohydrate kinase [Calditrichia bacterium]NUQ43515.1 carbohydrate kinase [Calditrichaceae bacterium]